MITIQSQTTTNKLQDKTPKVEEILETLRQRDSQLFLRIVGAIRYDDDKTSRILATEVAKIRKIVAIIEHSGTIVKTSGQRYPDLLLCPICCSPEISISQGKALVTCHCLECDKKWAVGTKDHLTIQTNQFWSVA